MAQELSVQHGLFYEKKKHRRRMINFLRGSGEALVKKDDRSCHCKNDLEMYSINREGN